MPAPQPPEFPQRAVKLARMRDKPIGREGLGLSRVCATG